MRAFNRKRAKKALDATSLAKRPKHISEDDCKEDTVFVLPMPIEPLKEKLCSLFRKFKTLSLHALLGDEIDTLSVTCGAGTTRDDIEMLRSNRELVFLALMAQYQQENSESAESLLSVFNGPHVQVKP